MDTYTHTKGTAVIMISHFGSGLCGLWSVAIMIFCFNVVFDYYFFVQHFSIFYYFTGERGTSTVYVHTMFHHGMFHPKRSTCTVQLHRG